MNLETGLKEARLMDNSDGRDYFKALSRWLEKNSDKLSSNDSKILKKYSKSFGFENSNSDKSVDDHNSFLQHVMNVDDSSAPTSDEVLDNIAKVLLINN